MAEIEAYRHFQNYFYLRLGRAVDETGAPLTIYRCLKEDKLYCRPEDNFHGIAKTKSYTGPRFEKIPGYEVDIEREQARLAKSSSFDVMHSETGAIYAVKLDARGEGHARVKPQPSPALLP